MSTGAAFFDLDRTLISGSSAFAFAVAAWRNDLVPSGPSLKDAAGAIAFRHRGANDDQVERVRARILGAVIGVRQADLVALNAELIPKLLSRVRPEAQRLIEMHRRAGRNTYIVSASPKELVEPLAAAIGMTGGIGTVSAVDADGVYTGELAGPFVYGPGKVAAIKEIADWEGYDLEHVVRLQRLGQRPADAGGRRPPGRRQPRRRPGPRGPRPRLAHRDLPPPDPARRAPHHRPRRRRRHGRRPPSPGASPWGKGPGRLRRRR